MERAITSILVTCSVSLLVQGQFTPGRLAVLEMPFIPNGGGWTIPTTGGQLVIREFSTDGASGFAVDIPSTGPDMLVTPFLSSGASLTRSPQGDKLVFTGWTGTSDGSFNLATSSGATIPRGIGTVDGQGNYLRPFVSSTFFSGTTINAACTDGVNYWAVGGNSGTCYLGPGTPVAVNTDVVGASDVQFVNGALFRGSGSGGLQQVGIGSPVSPTTAQTLFAMSALQGFQISPAGDVIYANNGSQVRKWVLSGGSWSNPYGFTTGTALARIAVDFSGAQPVIYALKNSPSSIVRFIDGGAPSTGTTIASTNGAAWYGITFTPTGGCAEGAPCDDDNPNTIGDMIRSDCGCSGTALLLNARVLLDGPYDPGTGLMNDALRALPDFPFTEPYTALGLVPSGGAGTVSAPVLSTTGNNAIVDWVLVELRDAVVGSTVLLRTPALLQRDGDIVSVDGASTLQLPAEVGQYRVAVRHRNHLGVMTNTAVQLSSGAISVDLTLPTTATWGTNARKDAGNVRTLWSGEVVRNGQLSYTGPNNDRDPILFTLGSTQPNAVITAYRVQDVNLNGQVKYTGTGNDRDLILVNVGSTTPNTVRVEQLP